MVAKKETEPKRVTRAWQFVAQVGKEHNRPWSLCTLNEPRRAIGTVTFEAQIVLLDPNHALQYVIEENAIEYEAQIVAMLKNEQMSDGELQEMNLKSADNPNGTDEIGVIPDRFIHRPPEVQLQMRVEELEEESAKEKQANVELRAELEAYKKAMGKSGGEASAKKNE